MQLSKMPDQLIDDVVNLREFIGVSHRISLNLP
jgi:hypothetical protein